MSRALICLLFWVCVLHGDEFQIIERPPSFVESFSSPSFFGLDESTADQIDAAIPNLKSALSSPGALTINEVVASNRAGLEDVDGDRPDWIELFNPTSAAINLAGFGLSDEPSDPFKWRFPLRLIPARGFLIVFASGKARTNTLQLHTNFKLDKDGESLVLTRVDGRTVDVLELLPTRPDLSYGRSPDGGLGKLYFLNPTPLATNGSLGASEWLKPPAPSHSSGNYSDRFTIKLLRQHPTDVVRYTLDGSEPDEKSLTYEGPVEISDLSLQPNGISMISSTATNNQHTDGWRPPLRTIRKATVMRARAFRSGALPSETTTSTYWVGTGTKSQLPKLSVALDPDDLFDYRRGIYVLGEVFATWRKSHPREVLTGHSPANYTQRGPLWERPGSLEFFDSNGAARFERIVDVDIQGQSSRSFRQKTLGIKVRDSPIEYSLFPGNMRRSDGTDPGRIGYTHFRLRNGGNDWAYSFIRDAFAHELVNGLPMDRQAYFPIELFLNGEYWGIHELREHYDDQYFELHYGIPKRHVAIASAYGSLVEGPAGSNQSFMDLLNFAQLNDLTLDRHYQEIQKRMDMGNFILYQAVCIILGNADWPHNNLRVWRDTRAVRPLETLSPTDGRWRWLLFDCDLALGHPWSGGIGDETLKAATSPTGRAGVGDVGWSTVLFRKLLANPNFKRRFLVVTADLLNSWFRENRTSKVLREITSRLEGSMQEHLDRWRTQPSVAAWKNQLRVLENFCSQRPILIRQQFVTLFRLPGYARLSLDLVNSGKGSIKLNEMRLNPNLPGVETPVYPWSGWYFKGVPIRLEAIPQPGYRFVQWRNRTGSSVTSTLAATNVIEMSLDDTTEIVAEFDRVPVQISSDVVRAAELQMPIFNIRVLGAPVTEYWVESSEDLLVWKRLGNIVTDSLGNTLWSSELSPNKSLMFFRVTRN